MKSCGFEKKQILQIYFGEVYDFVLKTRIIRYIGNKTISKTFSKVNAI